MVLRCILLSLLFLGWVQASEEMYNDVSFRYELLFFLRSDFIAAVAVIAVKVFAKSLAMFGCVQVVLPTLVHALRQAYQQQARARESHNKTDVCQTV